jgi:hypothetical protein
MPRSLFCFSPLRTRLRSVSSGQPHRKESCKCRYYKQFPGLVLPSGQKLSSGLLSHTNIEIHRFRACAPFPVPWRYSAPPAIPTRSSQLCQMATVKQRQVLESQVMTVGWVMNDSHLVVGPKFIGENRCVVVIQQPIILAPKFQAKSSHIFTQSP